MSAWEEWRKRLFAKGGNTLLHEVIKRPGREQRSQRVWSNQIPVVLDTLSKSYHYKKAGIKAPWYIHLFESYSANGFALSHPQDMSPLDFQHLFDLLRDQVLTMGYRLANSDRKIKEVGDLLRTVEKHYLKPITPSLMPPINQRFGNVLIELMKEDDEPRYIKVMVTAYNDRMYEPAQSFDDFLELLFTPPNTTA